MNAFWNFFWPLVGFGLLAGVVCGLVAFRLKPKADLVLFARRRNLLLAATGATCVAVALLWAGPLGAADRFVAQVNQEVRKSLVDNEMTMMHAELHRHPLTRNLALTGPADDFQRGALAQALEALPGVSSASWDSTGGGVPLVVEAAIAVLLGFAIGLLPAYLVELRRRYNAQWSW